MKIFTESAFQQRLREERRLMEERLFNMRRLDDMDDRFFKLQDRVRALEQKEYVREMEKKYGETPVHENKNQDP